MYYKPFNELLSDNGTNFLVNVVEYYLKKLYIWHKYMTIYYPQTNRKVKNLNSSLSDILTKYVVDKPTKLWDE